MSALSPKNYHHATLRAVDAFSHLAVTTQLLEFILAPADQAVAIVLALDQAVKELPPWDWDVDPFLITTEFSFGGHTSTSAHRLVKLLATEALDSFKTSKATHDGEYEMVLAERDTYRWDAACEHLEAASVADLALLQSRLEAEWAKVLAELEVDGEGPIDWGKLREATKKAPQQYELIRILSEAGGWVEFDDLAETVWNGGMPSTPAVRQLILRSNKTLTAIGAKRAIRTIGERAIIS